MKLLAHLNRSVHRLHGGGVVITVALLSMAAASILVLAP